MATTFPSSICSTCVLERDTMSLHPTFVLYISGAMGYLTSETDKDNLSIREVKAHFCNFIRKMIKNFPRKSTKCYSKSCHHHSVGGESPSICSN